MRGHTIGVMQRLSGLDASFLYLETAPNRCMCARSWRLDTSTVPGGYTFDKLRDELAVRIKAMPEFREKLADSRLNLDHPVWVEDKDFDVDRHLHRIGLPAPGGRVELAEICGHIASLPLDRSRPLWEMWVIEGVAGTDAHDGGRLAVMTKVHHAAVDGVTGANLMSQLCTTEPDAPPPDAGEGRRAAADQWRSPVAALVKFATRPLHLATNVLPARCRTVVDTVRRAISGLAMASPFTAPQTAFNASVTGHRNVAFAQLDLEDVKTVKNHFGVKVNDVVMALVSGVLRQLPARPRRTARLVAGGHGPGIGARQVRPAGPQQGVRHVLQPAHRHRGPGASGSRPSPTANSVAKEHSSAIAATLLQDWSQFAAPAVFGVAMRVYASTRLTEARPVHNLVVSNVPGPQMPLYFLGAEVKAMYPLGPIFHGSGLNITVMSLNGKLDVGPDLLPGTAAGPLGHGRRFRRRDGGTARGGTLTRSGADRRFRAAARLMAACVAMSLLRRPPHPAHDR